MPEESTVPEVDELLKAPADADGAQSKKKPKKEKRRFWKHKDVNQGEQSFAVGLNFYKIVWLFLIGCFIGVFFETFYVFYKEGVWMRRSGMLYGPFNQIYGIGAVLFTVLLYRFRNKGSLAIFIASFVLGLAFEYSCSWVQEILFGSVSWEYSDMQWNIGGRTNLFYGFGWGLMGLIFLSNIWPFLSEMIERIPNTIGKPLTIIIAVFLAVDLALSAAAVYRQKQRIDGVPAQTFIGQWLDETYPDSVMKEKYPSMTFVNENTDPASAQTSSSSGTSQSSEAA